MQMTEKEFREQMQKELIDDVRDERARKKAASASEREARDKDFHGFADKLMESVSDVEIAEYQRSVGKRGRQKKAMVFHGADYPR
jgi:hypothetical protein